MGMTEHGDQEKSEIGIALETLWENHVEPPQHIEDQIDEIQQLQLVHDLICNQLDVMRKATSKDIMIFFLEWKNKQ